MKRLLQKLLIGLALAAPLAALAADPLSPRLGGSTRAWLELQRSGNASLATPRPMPGEVADKVYERYVNSFAHAIPETFSREQFVGGSSSGGGSSR
jgi:hypothetical protein